MVVGSGRTQLAAPHLAGVVAKRFGHALDGVRHLVGGYALPDPGDELVVADVFGELDQGMGRTAEVLVRETDERNRT